MKAFATLSVILAAAFSASAGTATLSELNSHLFTNAVIIWQAPTNHLPNSFWVYQRRLPRVFSQTIISNAITLGSLQGKGFPKPSTDDFFIAEKAIPDCPCPTPVTFGIRPGDATIFYGAPAKEGLGSNKEIPGDVTIVSQAWKVAAQLGVDPMQLVQRNLYTQLCNTVSNGEEVAGNPCGRGVFLARQLDGIAFFSAGEDGEGAEGISIAFGSHGKIRDFTLRWSEVERYQSRPTATMGQIIRCVRAHKIIVLPNYDEADYFARLRSLAATKTLTVTKITPYYSEGIFGEMPTNDAPYRFATPFVELEATADFGNSNAVVRFVSPILSSEVNRLLAN